MGGQGGYTLMIQERKYAHFQIVLFWVRTKEVFAHDIYTKDELRTFCACPVFFAKTAQNQSWSLGSARLICSTMVYGFIVRKVLM